MNESEQPEEEDCKDRPGAATCAPISVISIDDNPLIADVISLLLSSEPKLKHIEHFLSGEGVIDVIKRNKGFTAVILDYEIPGTDTIGLLRQIKQTCPKCPVIVLSAHGRPEFIEAARRAGASGYTLKSEPPATILKHILRIASGETLFHDGKA